MIIVGERINSTRPKIQEAIKNRNASHILKEVRAQLENGANFIDINCALTSGDEVQDIDWLVSVIQSQINDVSLCIDSPNCLAIERALKVYKAKGELMINSITADEDRIKKILPLAIAHNAKLVALTMDEHGMPDDAHGRFEIAKKIVSRVKKDGFMEEDLYFDPLVRPIATEPKQAKEFLKAIPMIKSLGKVKTICGLSNVSFGLPNRRLINSSFLAMAIAAGLDAAILDPLDNRIISSLKASQTLMGMDEYCADYIKFFREGKLI
ncbi:MAG: dihydropteroate synthase [Candidatus Omnitrophota bacterium]|nr:dihydropteroate synthase [Candidatus Omnitrophota bacterium]